MPLAIEAGDASRATVDIAVTLGCKVSGNVGVFGFPRESYAFVAPNPGARAGVHPGAQAGADLGAGEEIAGGCPDDPFALNDLAWRRGARGWPWRSPS